MARIRIALVDDHQIVREGLRASLAVEPDMEIVADARTGAEALRLARSCRPDVMLLDVRLEDMEGPEVCRGVLEDSPRTGVIMLTSYRQEAVLMRSLAAGARGYVIKDVDLSELKRMVRLVYRGNSVVDPQVTGHLIAGWAAKPNGASKTPASALTASDLTIIRHLSEGLTLKEIGARVHLSPHTVKDRLEKIKESMGVHSRAEVITKAVSEGLILSD
jgi:two-component system NarL family response regulator